ncbi:MAG: SocA family protein [Lachnospiraceae bacterium]|nr:SocA family protein [Lachnospiraceae bacterium]
MASAKEIAIYLMQLDENGMFSDTTLLESNGRMFYVGRARLNKYLHLAQNIYYAKTSKLLFQEPLYAYDNGGVVEVVRENFELLLKIKDNKEVNLSDSVKEFLIKLFLVLKNADINKLIELSHEDPEWIAKHAFYRKQDQIMDTVGRLNDYKEQYADIIRIMDGMTI